MLKNYLKIAIRIITRNKVFSFINILGLAIGMACTIIILLWVQDEVNYDKFHTNLNDLYRVVYHDSADIQNRRGTGTPGPLGPTIKEKLPDVMDYCRIFLLPSRTLV